MISDREQVRASRVPSAFSRTTRNAGQAAVASQPPVLNTSTGPAVNCFDGGNNAVACNSPSAQSCSDANFNTVPCPGAAAVSPLTNLYALQAGGLTPAQIQAGMAPPPNTMYWVLGGLAAVAVVGTVIAVSQAKPATSSARRNPRHRSEQRGTAEMARHRRAIQRELREGEPSPPFWYAETSLAGGGNCGHRHHTRDSAERCLPAVPRGHQFRGAFSQARVIAGNGAAEEADAEREEREYRSSLRPEDRAQYDAERARAR